jgi:hypothetical protein
MTVMAEAMVAAGYVPVADRLLTVLLSAFDNPQGIAQPELERSDERQAKCLQEVSMAAIKQSPRNWDGAKDALYRLVKNDADLLWEMFQPYRAQAAQRLLTEAAQAYRQEELAAEMRRWHSGNAVGAGRVGHVSQNRGARPTRKSSISIEAIAVVAQASLLDTFQVNGRPIGDLTSEEAEKWAASRERDARFIRLLTQNLPPGLPIRKFRTADDAAALYAMAQGAGHE